MRWRAQLRATCRASAKSNPQQRGNRNKGALRKLFKNGGSQAVRLPKACRFPDDQREVVVRKVGRRVVLEPVDAWPQKFLACMGAWPEELARPKVAPIRSLRDPFA